MLFLTYSLLPLAPPPTLATSGFWKSRSSLLSLRVRAGACFLPLPSASVTHYGHSCLSLAANIQVRGQASEDSCITDNMVPPLKQEQHKCEHMSVSRVGLKRNIFKNIKKISKYCQKHCGIV